MKKLFPIYIMVFAAFVLCNTPFSVSGQSQSTYWGMTNSGGAEDRGVIYRTDAFGGNYEVLYEAALQNDGASPLYNSFCQASNGRLYGMTTEGGLYGYGVLFEFDPVTFRYAKLRDFNDDSLGKRPCASLIQAVNGKLYGMTSMGGINDYGVLFEYNLTTNTYTKLFDFDGYDHGRYPEGTLMQAANGKIYGATTSGGVNDIGTLFEYVIQTGTLTKFFDFEETTTGMWPFGALMQASNGKLYGTTANGGQYYGGVIFEIDTATHAYTKLIELDNYTMGKRTMCKMIQAPNGKLYGTNVSGSAGYNGTLFEYDIPTNTYTVKHEFEPSGDEESPKGDLVLAPNGKLYGMTRGGGVNYTGTIFSYDIAGESFTTVYDMVDYSLGYGPYGSLMMASDGKLYGMTTQGGFNETGAIFEYDIADSLYTKKANFSAYDLGTAFRGSMMQASNGKIYGMSSENGAYGRGMIFEFDPNHLTYTKKMDFISERNGADPFGAFLEVYPGKLWGMTMDGGANDAGVIFEYDIMENKTIIKYTFDYDGGDYPNGSLMKASNGKLYGMTMNGGVNDAGVIFEYDPVTSTYTKKHDFLGWVDDGAYPYGDLVEADNGKLYGMTNSGGYDVDEYGIIFEYDPATDNYAIKVRFDTTGGCPSCYSGRPQGSLIKATNGKLYGLTYSGGPDGYGALFVYDPDAETYTVLVNFDNNTGGNPEGTLRQMDNGKLYGLTKSGCTNDGGGLFEFDITTNTLTVKYEFDGTTGWDPSFNQLLEIKSPFVWTGNVSDDWNTAFNWRDSVVPTDIDNALIPHVLTHNPVVYQDPGTPAVCRNLVIEEGAVLSIAPNKSLVVNNFIANYAGTGGLIILSDATGTGSLLHFNDNVAATVDRYISGSSSLRSKKYHLVSVPLNSDTYLSGLWLDSYLFTYNEYDNSWRAWDYITTNTLQTHEGAMVFYPKWSGTTSKTYHIKGQLNNGPYTPAVNYSGFDFGYNLVPNPYPSAIDWDASSGWIRTNISNIIWGFNPAVQNYGTWNGSTGTNSMTGIIPVGQGFFVKATDYIPELLMNNEVRLADNTPFLKSGTRPVNTLHLIVSSPTGQDEIAVQFAYNGSMASDDTYDAVKFYSSMRAPQLSSYTAADSKLLSISGLPLSQNTTAVPLQFEMDTSCMLTFTASGTGSFESGTTIQLEDRQLGRMVDMRANSSYSFNHDEEDAANRFILYFGNVAGIEEETPLQSQVMVNMHDVYVTYPVSESGDLFADVYDLQGSVVSRSRLDGSGDYHFTLATSGVYFVKLWLASGAETHKIVVL